MKNNGVRLQSVVENFDNSPESIILESVIEGMAEYYSANLGRETIKGLKENAHNGVHTGGRPPLGYKINPMTKHIEVDENEANDGISLEAGNSITFKAYASVDNFDRYDINIVSDNVVTRLKQKKKAG